MDDGQEPGRIEVELTSHGPATHRTDRAAEAATGDAPGPGGLVTPGVLGTERRRLVAVGSAVAVLALAVGVLVGRSGSGGQESAGDPARPPSAATSTTRPNRDTLPAAPSLPAPSTTRPERTTTTMTTTTIDPELVVEGSITVNPVLTPEKAELIALTRQGAVVRIDVITGATRTTHPVSFGASFVAAGDGWILMPDDRGGLVTIADDGSRSPVDLGGWWPPLTADGGGFWRAEFDEPSGRPSRLVRMTLDGSDAGEVIELDGHHPQFIDPRGGVVVQAPGGYFVLTPHARTRVTVGQLHALGRRRALVRECDERLECGFFVVDRDSGAREPLHLDAELERQLEAAGFGWWGFGTPLSPDEDALVVTTFDDAAGPDIGVLELSTGSYTALGGFENEPQATWGPGGRYLYWLDAGRIMVFDRSTGASVLFSDDLDTVTALTVRPFPVRP